MFIWLKKLLFHKLYYKLNPRPLTFPIEPLSWLSNPTTFTKYCTVVTVLLYFFT